MVGTVINKFRGDVDILRPGLAQLEELTGVPVLGVVPYSHARIDDEDSLAESLQRADAHRAVDVAVVRLPRISNFTDFAPLEEHPALGVRYVRDLADLGTPDIIILPGTKSTMDDLLWLRQSGLEMAVRKLAERDVPVLGICGGYQMMGEELRDPHGVERGGALAGMGLLPCRTVFANTKTRTRTDASILATWFEGTRATGYQIHMGATTRTGGAPFARLTDGSEEGCVQGLAMGTYLHGLFDTGAVVDALTAWLLARKGMDQTDVHALDHAQFQQQQIAQLASEVRTALNMDAIYRAMEAFDR